MKHHAIWFAALLLSLFVLSGCASVPATQATNAIPVFTTRAWLAELPEGEFSIGIAYADPVFDRSSSALAKDFAAVAISRNHASYIVDKQILLELAKQTELNLTSISYNVVVSADLDFLHQAASNLVLVDCFVSHGLFIGLYSLKQAKVTKTDTQMNPAEKPEWAAKTGVQLRSDKLYSVATSHQAELADAFYAAQEQALRQIAQYRLQNVMAKIRSINDETDQALALETVTKNQNCLFHRFFIEPQQLNETLSYTVTMELIAQP